MLSVQALLSVGLLLFAWFFHQLLAWLPENCLLGVCLADLCSAVWCLLSLLLCPLELYALLLAPLFCLLVPAGTLVILCCCMQ